MCTQLPPTEERLKEKLLLSKRVMKGAMEVMMERNLRMGKLKNMMLLPTSKVEKESKIFKGNGNFLGYGRHGN